MRRATSGEGNILRAVLGCDASVARWVFPLTQRERLRHRHARQSKARRGDTGAKRQIVVSIL
jgi:hypothetical protein